MENDILSLRLKNQQLLEPQLKNPKDLVSWFGAIQSQDLPGAKWALGQRLGLNNKDISLSYEKGEILRTHVMRPTWHFVTGDDIYWLLKLTGDRVKAVMRTYTRGFGVTEETIEKCTKIFEKELKNNPMTRKEIGEMLSKYGFKWEGNGLAHIVSICELNAVLTSGPMKGNQTTYALLNKRTTHKTFTRDEALKEITRKYFQSHGPALLKDFAWWSGLTIKDGLLGLEQNSKVQKETVDGKTYYFFKTELPKNTDKVFLLPNYDEYTVAYRDRELLYGNVDKTKLDARGDALFNNAVLINGKVEGIWRKIRKPKEMILDMRLFRNLDKKERELLNEITLEFSSFLSFPVKLTIS